MEQNVDRQSDTLRMFSPSEAAIAHLCGAVKFATVSNECDDLVDWEPFTGLHAYLRDTYPLLHKTLEREVVGKGSLLYRWPGKGRGMPFALLAHMDVVPIEHPENWKYDPFSGYYDGTFIWGRGSADMKCQMIAILEAIEQLISEGFTPNQDVYLCFGHNEEVMSSHSGAKMMAELLRARGVTLEFVADEAGSIMMEPPFGIESPVVMIGMAEKGFANLQLTVRGAGGHSAEPEGRSAMQKVSEFILELERQPLPYRLIPTVEAYVHNLAEELPAEQRRRILEEPAYVFRKMAEDKKCHAMVRTTVVPTILRCGAVFNSIPSAAELVLNARILPGDTVSDVCLYVERTLQRCGIEDYTLEVLKSSPPPMETPADSEAYCVLREVYKTWNPCFLVTPYLVTGGTDSKNYTGVTKQIYRISASMNHRNRPSGAHGENEHIPAATLGNAIQLMYRLILAQSARYDETNETPVSKRLDASGQALGNK